MAVTRGAARRRFTLGRGARTFRCGSRRRILSGPGPPLRIGGGRETGTTSCRTSFVPGGRRLSRRPGPSARAAAGPFRSGRLPVTVPDRGRTLPPTASRASTQPNTSCAHLMLPNARNHVPPSPGVRTLADRRRFLTTDPDLGVSSSFHTYHCISLESGWSDGVPTRRTFTYLTPTLASAVACDSRRVCVFIVGCGSLLPPSVGCMAQFGAYWLRRRGRRAGCGRWLGAGSRKPAR
jgi:hypothetical protein